MWLTLAFLSAALLGFYEICIKQSIRDNAVIPVLVLNTLFSSLLFLPFIVLSKTGQFLPGDLFYVAQTTASVQGYIAIKSGLVLVSWILGYIGLKHLPLTLVGPINATRPVMTLLGAIFIFGEMLNFLQWMGVIIAIISFYLLNQTGKREGFDVRQNRWLWCTILGCIVGASCGLYDKFLMAPPDAGGLGLDRMAVQSYYNFYQFLMMGLVLLVAWLPTKKISPPFRWKWPILGISLFLSAADFAYLYSLSLEGAMISVVSMIRRCSVLVSFTFAAIVFKEKNLREKAIDLALVFVSVILLFFGTQA